MRKNLRQAKSQVEFAPVLTAELEIVMGTMACIPNPLYDSAPFKRSPAQLAQSMSTVWKKGMHVLKDISLCH